MDDIFYEMILYRILQGRLRLKLGDLVLYVYEPSLDLLEESLEIYYETYNQSYFSGVPIKSELLETLVDNNLWTPHDDKEAEKIEKQIEDLKVEAFKNFFKKKSLYAIKMNIRMMEKKHSEFASKKMSLDHTSCEGAAAFARAIWLISKTTKNLDGSDYNWEKYNISHVMQQSNNEEITGPQFRKVARSEPWRSMWLAGKKQSNVFGKPTYQLSKNQAALCGFSSMYDNVYESHESPDAKVIEDDDCLDGWMIQQRRDVEKQKKQKETDALIKNPKIANSDEIFVMAQDQNEAQSIYGLNDGLSRSVVGARQEQLRQNEKESGDSHMRFTDFHDVKQDISTQAATAGIESLKGRHRSK